MMVRNTNRTSFWVNIFEGEPEVDLDSGEQQAIALAEEVAADLLLVDDWDARLEAKRRRLRVVGTLRVLADGAQWPHRSRRII